MVQIPDEPIPPFIEDDGELARVLKAVGRSDLWARPGELVMSS